MSFGQRVRELRRQYRLTQRELADKLKVDFTYISKIENDKLEAPPSEELIRRLASFLEADAEDLLDLAGKIDAKALQELASDVPEAGKLLRRLQSRRISRKQIRQFLDETEGSVGQDAD
jgi:transcriptional regulator with XRE-family HTH domain